MKLWGGGQRDATLDRIKGYGICLMVCGHSGFMHRNWIYLFHMALFFMASGYMWNDIHATSIKTLWRYFKKKIRSLYVPFVIINLFFTVTFNWFYRIGIYSSSNIDGILSVQPLDKNGFIKTMLKVFAFSGGSQLAGATWFLRTLFCVTVSNAIIVYVFKKLHIEKAYIYCMLLITGVGAMFVNNNWLFIGEILEKIGLRAYFASYFAYILGALVKRMKIMEQITKRKKEAVVISFLTLCFLNYVGEIELNVGHIENIAFYLIASLAGWIMIAALASNPSKINVLMSYIGRNSIWILGLHFLSFKLVSFIWIRARGLHEVYLAAYPVIREVNFLWVAYFIAGVSIPLLIELLYRKLYARWDCSNYSK